MCLLLNKKFFAKVPEVHTKTKNTDACDSVEAAVLARTAKLNVFGGSTTAMLFHFVPVLLSSNIK